MHPSTEAPPRTLPADSDQPLRQPEFGHAGSDRNDDDHHRIGDAVDGPTEDRAPPEHQRDFGGQTADQVAIDDQRRDEATRPDGPLPDAATDGLPHDEHRMDEPSDVHPGDDTGTTPDDNEPGTSEEPSYHDPAAETPAQDEPAAGLRGGEATSRDEPGDLKPGDGAATVVAAIWAEGSAQDFRDRWREAQLRFVDDPRQAAEDTRHLVNEAVDALTAALASHREQLNALPTNGDTEQYRQVVQRCRTFFEHLLTV
jgi:hypothetical protein